ncbi:SusC/RagA family TonB-linked outer membrane protein [Chitinophaga lutea]
MKQFNTGACRHEHASRQGAPFQPKIRLFAFLLFLLCSTSIAVAQSTVSGTVRDKKGGGLPGVTVRVKNINSGTVSDKDGRYSLSVPDANGALLFTMSGFEAREVQLAGRSSVDVTLSESLTGLNEVVVIGYGTQSKDMVTTAISKMDTMVLKNVPYANPAYALQGTLPGVRVMSTSGQPGAAPTVVVRGGTALDPNTSYPLYVIDGVISPDLTGINPADIESVQVLKDAASTAIYGARGSNGVVIVTTKAGKAGKTTVTYNYNLTLSNYKTRMEMLNGRDFIYYNRLAIDAAAVKFPAFAGVLTNASSAGIGNDLTNRTFYTTQYLTPENEHKLQEGWKSMPDPLDPSKTIIYQETDWRDVMYRTAVSQNHNLSASGGTDKSTYSVSLGYLSNSGIAIQTDYRRLSLNTRGEVKLRDNLKVFSDILYSSDKSMGVSAESNIFGRMLQVAPTVKYKFEDGTLAQGPNGNKGNPEYRENIVDGERKTEKYTLSLGARWDILPNLSFTPKISQLKRSINTWSFVKSNYDGLNFDVTRSASESEARYTANQADAVLAYNKSFNNAHNLDVTAGFSYLGTEEARLSAAGRGAATDLIPTLNASAVPTGVSSSRAYYRYIGYFGRILYNYRQRYLLSLSTRYDGSSNLGADYKWGMFPGVSAGWNIHNESFWEPLRHSVSQLKLRGSYGVNGNVNGIGPYQAQGSYGVGAVYGGVSAITNTILENPELKWEQARTFDAGLDLGLINNRINFTFDYYRRVTKNLISSRTLPMETGFGSILTNLGTIENRGVDMAVDVRVLPATSVFQWNLSVNAAYVKNKILKLPPNGIANNRIGGIYVWSESANAYVWAGGLQEGGTMGDLFGYRQLGLYQSDADAGKGPVDMLVEGADKTKFGGDVIWKDFDRNDTIDARDQEYMGNIYPKWTGGLINTFSYKNMYLTIRMDFMTGQTIYNYMRATTTGQFAGDLGLSADAGRSWQKPGDNTEIPRLYYGDYQSNLLRGNSIMYEKGNYLALREVTFSYELSRQLLQRWKISGLRFNLTGNNLHYFSKYKGINPENGGTDNGSYPISANYIFGATITL